jgi:DNA-binding beta-propeller fold protein YncE
VRTLRNAAEAIGKLARNHILTAQSDEATTRCEPVVKGETTMPRCSFAGIFMLVGLLAATSLPTAAPAQSGGPPSIEPPNPFAPAVSFGQLPDGRTWGGTTAVAVGADGKSVWVFERCGAESCAASNLPPILHFDPSGKLLASFGAGMFVFPHGITIDRDGNVWVADADGKNGKGQQVVKFSPTGKVLLTLGHAGMAGDAPGYFNRPTGVAIARNGDIFVADGHGGDSNARVVKFSKSGKFLTAWGKKGGAPGEFDTPHAIAVDSHERVYVADRSNSRIQVFDADGKFIADWRQFGRPSGVYVDANDMIYVADSQTMDKTGCTPDPGCRRGIRIGSAADGTVKYFIPRPQGDMAGPEGVAADANGTVYGASNEGKRILRFSKKP